MALRILETGCLLPQSLLQHKAFSLVSRWDLPTWTISLGPRASSRCQKVGQLPTTLFHHCYPATQRLWVLSACKQQAASEQQKVTSQLWWSHKICEATVPWSCCCRSALLSMVLNESNNLQQGREPTIYHVESPHCRRACRFPKSCPRQCHFWDVQTNADLAAAAAAAISPCCSLVPFDKAVNPK
jgi:hypothetical protein